MFNACKKGGDTSSSVTPNQGEISVLPAPAQDIYVTGVMYSGSNPYPVYWKNGTLVRFAANNVTGTATAIFIQNNDIYISGTILLNNRNWAVYWKNNEITLLSEGSANDVFVQGSDVYIAGKVDTYVNGSLSYHAAAYWKNGVSTKLSNPTGINYAGNDAEAKSIAVSATNDVYTAGTGYAGGTVTVALFWKNAVSYALTQYFAGDSDLNAKSGASQIALNGTDIYISGFIVPATGTASRSGDIGGAVYWKNNTGIQPLTYSTTAATNIAIQGADVYVVITNDTGGPTYLKNGKSTQLDMGSYRSINATGIAIYDNDCYISGCDPTNNSGPAVYWKNGTIVTLALLGVTTDIAVVKHL